MAEENASAVETTETQAAPAPEATEAVESTATEESAVEEATETADASEYDLFDEGVSEEELMGSTETTEEKAADSEPEGSKEGEEDGANKEEKTPPKGYVPHEALKEERAKRKEAQSRIAELERQLAERQKAFDDQDAVKPVNDQAIDASEYSDDVKAFAKSHPQYAALVLEDSEDGEILREQVEVYGSAEGVKQARSIAIERNMTNRRAREEAAAVDAVTRSVVNEMESMFDGGLNGEEAKALVAHLSEGGLTSDAITVLTSPNTEVIDPRTGQRFRMGATALNLVGILKEGFDISRKNSPQAVRDALEKEITEAVMAKIRGEKPERFRDIGTVPGHENAPKRIPVTEEDFARLSPEEQERLLMGDL